MQKCVRNIKRMPKAFTELNIMDGELELEDLIKMTGTLQLKKLKHKFARLRDIIKFFRILATQKHLKSLECDLSYYSLSLAQ